MPKGDCYISAGYQLFTASPDTTLVLVHGYPTLQRPPYAKYGHAWVEREDGLVLDYSNDRKIEMSRILYYAVGQIDPDECDRFTYRELIAMVDLHEHWGPW